jgi:hypothetical protein
MDADEGQDGKHDNDEADNIDDRIQGPLLCEVSQGLRRLMKNRAAQAV